MQTRQTLERVSRKLFYNALDPLLERLAKDHCDDQDLTAQLSQLFQARLHGSERAQVACGVVELPVKKREYIGLRSSDLLFLAFIHLEVYTNAMISEIYTVAKKHYHDLC